MIWSAPWSRHRSRSLTSKRRSVRRRERTQRRWSRRTYKLQAAARRPIPNSRRWPWSSASPRSCRRRCEHRNRKNTGPGWYLDLSFSPFLFLFFSHFTRRVSSSFRYYYYYYFFFQFPLMIVSINLRLFFAVFGQISTFQRSFFVI